MPTESWALQLRQRKRRFKILLSFNWTRKSNFLVLGSWLSSKRQSGMCKSWLKRKGKKVKRSWGEQLRYQREPSPPLQAAGETPGGRLFRSTDIIFWIRVRSKAASAGGNQFRRSRLFFLFTAYAKHTGLVAAWVRLWIHHHHQPSPFY